MQQFLSNGGLSKMLWIILIFILGLSAIVLWTYEIWNGQAINPAVSSIITGLLVHIATVGGHILGVGNSDHATSPGQAAAP